jgi:hypothetical protein
MCHLFVCMCEIPLFYSVTQYVKLVSVYRQLNVKVKFTLE